MRRTEKNRLVEEILALSCKRYLQEAIDMVKATVCSQCQAKAEGCNESPCRIAESLIAKCSQDLAAKNFMWN